MSNFLSRILAAMRGASVPSEIPVRYENPVWWGQFGHIPTELVQTVDQQLAVSVAWACVRAIVDPIAASEVKVYLEEENVRREDSSGWLWWLLNVEPHPQYTAQGWGELMGTRAVVTGNSYAYIRRDGTSRPWSMQPLDPVRVYADENESGEIGYWYDDPKNGEVWIPESEMIHMRGPMTSNFYGDSPLARASAALALAKAEETYATAYYANGAYPGVLLKPPAANLAPMTKDQKETARQAWKALFGGPRKKGGIGALDPGWALEIVETDAQKAMIVEARRYQVAEITRYFGVPGHLVGVPEASQGYGKNLAELGLGFVRQTLEPWGRRFSEELRRKLLPGRRQGQAWFIDYDLSRLTKGDEESVARAEEIALRNGVITINQAKSQRGLPSVPGGEVTRVGGVPLDQLDQKTDPLPDAAMGAVTVLANHARRAKARACDLAAGHAREGKMEKALQQLRWQARTEMRAAGVRSESREMDAALEAVEQGVEPEKAAERLAG